MDSESFLQKAERLQSLLHRLSEAPPLAPEDAEAREQIAIAVWLHDEFRAVAREDFPLSS